MPFQGMTRISNVEANDPIAIEGYLSTEDSRLSYICSEGNFLLTYGLEGGNAIPDQDVDPTDGIPDFVEKAGQYLEHAWTVEVLMTGSNKDYGFEIWLQETWGSGLLVDFWRHRMNHPVQSVMDSYAAILQDQGLDLAEESAVVLEVLAVGVYLVRLRTASFNATDKMMLTN